jgi:RNA recognition motif-containing protein
MPAMTGNEPLDRCNVFVKYLPPDMRDEGLYELFVGSGRITSCKVMLDHKTHSSLGYGYELSKESVE